LCTIEVGGRNQDDDGSENRYLVDDTTREVFALKPFNEIWTDDDDKNTFVPRDWNYHHIKEVGGIYHEFRFCVTNQGYIGRVPGRIKHGDTIAILI
jgi:hypothetical protein